MHLTTRVTLAELITPKVFDPIAWGQRSATPGSQESISRTLKAFY